MHSSMQNEMKDFVLEYFFSNLSMSIVLVFLRDVDPGG